jgi:ADP-ribose pyrophosphatase YjhB (NUDIX family)
MRDDLVPRVRVTGVLVEDGRLLLVRQSVPGPSPREWSLPGGTLEFGETIEECLVREMAEETGLAVKVGNLLYVADRIHDGRHIVHLTFLVHRVTDRVPGRPPRPDTSLVRGVELIALEHLTEYGFTKRFQELAMNGFPESGSYQGVIGNLGL